MFCNAAQELAKISQRAVRNLVRKRVCQMIVTQEMGEPQRIEEMVGQPAEAVALLAVHQVEPGKLAAESGFAVVLEGANHGNEVKQLDSLREPRYSRVMSIADIARYTPAVTAPAWTGCQS